MAFTGSALIDSLARRVRDTTNFAHDRPTLLDVLNRVSYVLNAATRVKLTSTSFTPAANRTLYQTDAVASGILRIVGVREAGGRDLLEIPWESLVLNDPAWLHTTGPRHEMFAYIGRDLFVLYPAVKSADIAALTVIHAKTPTALADDAVAWELPDDLEPVLLDLSEVLIYLRGRIFSPQEMIAAPLKRAADALGVEVPYAIKRLGEGF